MKKNKKTAETRLESPTTRPPRLHVWVRAPRKRFKNKLFQNAPKSGHFQNSVFVPGTCRHLKTQLFEDVIVFEKLCSDFRCPHVAFLKSYNFKTLRFHQIRVERWPKWKTISFSNITHIHVDG